MASPYLHALSCSKCGAALSAESGQRILACRYCGQTHAFVPPPQPERAGTRYAVGERVAVEWGGHWWPASVRESVGEHEWCVHFDSWGQKWDLVIGPSRIRHISQATRSARTSGRATLAFAVIAVTVAAVLSAGILLAVILRSSAPPAAAGQVESGAAGARAQPARAGDTTATYTPGQAVDIEWNGTWWAGKVLEVKDGQYKITYNGWSSSWDEWVGPPRLRRR